MVSVHQGLLVEQLNLIFPDALTHVNARRQTEIRYSITNNLLEFDVWIPQHHLCFEFQDQHHYVTTWYYQNPQSVAQHKDDMKKELARKKGVTYISVPCWWNGSINSLKSTIDYERPELLVVSASIPPSIPPVALNPPHMFFQEQELPGVGKLMLAQFTNDILRSMDHHSWWMGEKYDGVRFCWNPDQKLVYGRNATNLHVLPSLSQCLPTVFIDGEMWFGRDQFVATHELLNGSSDHVAWWQLRLVSFDAPSRSLQELPFEERYKRLLTQIAPDHPFLSIATRMICKGSDHMISFAQDIINNNGEGAVLRRVGSLYENGRSSALLKFKASQCDAEGTVMEMSKLGGVTLKLQSGRTISVPYHDILTEWPSVGDVVTFTFDVTSHPDSPANPKIVRIRNDFHLPLFMDDEEDSRTVNALNPPLWYAIVNRRRFFEEYATANGFDYLQPADWYMQSSKQIMETKGASRVVSSPNYSVQKALLDLFPNIGLHKTNFNCQAMWQSRDNRRRFFEIYAGHNKFDANDPNCWYSQSRDQIFSAKGASVVMSHHNNSVPQALIDLFPDINLDEDKFPRNYLHIQKVRQMLRLHQ